MKMYVGIEPLTMVRIGSGEAASMAYVYAGAPVPAGADPDDVDRLVDEGYLELREVGDPDAAGDRPTTIQGILDAVDDDPDLAQQYLDEEQAAEKPRSSLVGKLQAIVAAG